ncbi:MAG: PilZ domain-containing protein [Planctomycetota bacterium]|jgi:hypothetical protein
MSFDPRTGLTEAEDHANRRRTGRLGLEGVRCDLGEVHDLSCSGMGIVSRKGLRVGTETPVVIMAGPDNVLVRARVCRAKKLGLFRHELGLEFVDVTDETRDRLTGIASIHRMRRMF